MFAALLAVALLKLGAVGSGPRMLVGTQFWSDDLDNSARGEWWAICRTPREPTDQLVKVTAKFRRKPHPLDDKLGWTLRTDGCADTAMLLRDWPGLEAARAVSRATRKTRGSKTVLTLDGTSTTLTDTRRVSRENAAHHRVVLRSGDRTQVLMDLDAEAESDILWAGDLDGDGKLDLLLRVPSHEAATDVRLYLSTGAKGNELVRQVASQLTANC
jgi:hypothetical protein